MRHLEIVLDASGSMQGMNEAAYAGAKELLNELDDEGTVRLTTFNSVVTRGEDMSKAQALDAFAPGTCSGTTALYDGIVDALGDALETHASEEPRTVVVAIVTDGMENASRRATVSNVRDTIARAHAKEWRVTFLGSNQDAVLTAHMLGIQADRALTYGTSPTDMRQAYRALSAANRRYASGESEAFTSVERTASMPAEQALPARTGPPPVHRSASVGTTRAVAAPVHKWVSLDPRTGALAHYNDAVSASLDGALTAGVSHIVVPEFSATIFLQDNGQHLQKTASGERDVRRVIVGQTVRAARHGENGHRIVQTGGREIVVS